MAARGPQRAQNRTAAADPPLTTTEPENAPKARKSAREPSTGTRRFWFGDSCELARIELVAKTAPAGHVFRL
uniref:hypothetical protein n=1 Tax=Laribacter hongkongensis TaxID=168471 RepID=UPI00155DB949|nr:hypothetical protein [Laribacter hongkongensis]